MAKATKSATKKAVVSKKAPTATAVAEAKSEQPKKATAAKKVAVKKVERILISQPRPESEKSPYYDLERKHNVKLTFHQFIKLEPFPAKEFRKQKIELSEYNAVILNSRNAVDHFFRICEEMKFKVSQEMRYFCITEAIALYLQKFILYRKRKVFFSADGSVDGLMDVLAKYKDSEKFLIPVSENTKNDISPSLIKNKYQFAEAILYRTVPNDMETILKGAKYDAMILFSPFGVDAILSVDPNFKQGHIVFGGFGNTTQKALEDVGYEVKIKAPVPNAPSMVAALDRFLAENNK
ncbi:uroporphyrinogen-III synthase [Taibaiella sp. KBW10]|uniref:uroporphyrinogen-III synthase n=1 Tax=Taibaiella sp. KBW10 TaxID=2153357 RepID=UPI000F5B4CA1|nr:uroporphyrinogen-III synthase [Taibaiella sp. KBW10]RQO30565.1 uroporphyrinogen-III synthase [Taibaiella sp. KBW10]